MNKSTKTFKSLCFSLCLMASANLAMASPHPIDKKDQVTVFVQASDKLVSAHGYNIQIQPTLPGVPLPSVQEDVLRQSKLGDNVMLWIGGKSQEVIDRFPALIQEAKKYPNIKTVYLYDEMFWTKNGIEIGLQEDEVLAGAKISHEAGLNTAIVMLPEVILSPKFKLKDINAFDFIGIDVYPSGRADNNTYGCYYSSNIIENLLRCSIDKLTEMGFKGKVGYVYQAFALNSLPLETSLAHAALQRPVIDDSASYGVDVLVPWGMYLGAGEIAEEPFLVPLGGTKYEHLVALPR